MVRNHREAEIFLRALALAEEEDMHASHALLQALVVVQATDIERKASQEAYTRAIMTMPIGHGLDYDKELLRHALRDDPPPGGRRIRQKTKNKKERENKMSDNTITNETIIETTEAADGTGNVQSLATAKKQRQGRSRKYNVGDRYGITGTFGLLPTEAKDGQVPAVEFQFSYKAKKCQELGFGILPAGTEVTYLGCRCVFEGTSKKMVFKVPAGTLLADGTALDRDIEAAGVVSHIVEGADKAHAVETQAEAVPVAEAVGT